MSDLDGQEREALTAHIAERLREARAGKNWSQDQLANECGWTQAAVSLYEAGHRRTGIYELCVLAEKLERPLAFFLDQLPRVAALAAREEPHVKGAILQIGTVVEGRPEGWVFDGAHIGHLILPDGSQVCGGWTVSELELIGAAREDTERPTIRQHEELQRAYEEALGRANRAEKSLREDTERPDHITTELDDQGRPTRMVVAAREDTEPEAEMVWGEGPYEKGEDTERPDEDDGWDLDKPQRTKGQALGERVGHVPSDQVEDCERPLSRSVSECCKAWIDVKQGYYCPICGKECSVISKAL